MEYLRGRTLVEVIGEDAPLPVEQAAGYIASFRTRAVR